MQSLILGMDQSVARKFVPAAGVAIAIVVFLISLAAVRVATAQAQNGIIEPAPGSVISGVVSIRGTARHDAFMRYELAFNRGDGWLVFAEGDRPVVDGTLAIWDTTIGQPSNPVFPDGAYQLRLRVVRQDYNYDEYFVNDLVLANSMTPTPTATATLPQQATRQIGTPDPQASATSGFIIIRPTPLPSLTPFPSPSSPAAPSSAAAGTPAAPAGNNEDGDEGLLQRLLAIDTTRFGEAFWAGVRLAMFAFALIPLYLLVRALIRFAWRQFWTRDSHRN